MLLFRAVVKSAQRGDMAIERRLPKQSVFSRGRRILSSQNLSSSIVFASLLVLFINCSLLSKVSGVDSPEESEVPPVEQVLDHLSNGSTWVWPEIENPEASSKMLTTWLSSWCGDHWKDAMEIASTNSKEFDRLKKARDHQYEELKRCQLEKTSAEEDLQRTCVTQQKVHNASFERELAVRQAEFNRERSELEDELRSCKSKAKNRVDAACNRDAAVAQAATVNELAQVKASLEACELQKKSADVSRYAQLELEMLRIVEDRKAWTQERARLSGEVAECRPAKARAEAELSAYNLDVNQKTLERTVKWMGSLLLLFFLLFTASTSAVVYLMFFQENNGGIVGPASWVVATPPTRLQLLTAEQALNELQELYEKRNGYGVPIILTTNSEAEGGPPLVFLLVPLNVSSSRRFALFGGGGDYTGHLERAQEFVSKAATKARLVVVLFEYSGCVFTEETLKSLRMTADKVADEAVPRDADFPRRSDIVVLWLDRIDGLHAANSEGDSELVTAIKAQPWADFLLGRSGRWGDFSKSKSLS